jgi:hypothetical protein
MPTRSLHARGGVAPDDSFRLHGLGGHNALRAARSRPPVPGAGRPRSVAATAGGRMGMRAVWRAPASMICKGWPAEGASFFAGMSTRSLHARGAGAPGDSFRGAGLGGNNAHPAPAVGAPSPPPVAHRRDGRRADGDARGTGGAASMDARPGA